MKPFAAGLSALLLIAALAGCSSSTAAPGAESPAASGTAAQGPWAEAINSTYAESTDSRVKDSLSDGEISGQEVAFFKEQIVNCLGGLGLSGSWNDDGSLAYTGPKSVTQDSINDCNKKNGLDLITLHQAINRNPENLDEGEVMVSCLKRAKAVGPEYTARMYNTNVGLEDVLDSPEFDECNNDPLNYKKK